MAIPEIPENLENLVITREVLKALRDSISLAAGVLPDGSTPFTANQSMTGHRLIDVANPIAPQDAATKDYVDNIPGYVKKDGSTPFTGAQSMGGHKLTNVTDPTTAQDAATKNYVDTSSVNGNFIKKDGSVAFTGDQSLGNHKLTNVTNPASAQDAATKNYVDTQEALDVRLDGSRPMTGALNMGTHLINNVVNPASAQDAATKNYVDSSFTTAVLNMQGRVELFSATAVRLQRYTGNIVTVGSENVTLGSGKVLNNTDNLITALGADAGSAMAASTFYYLYLSNSSASFAPSSLRASINGPTSLNGTLYLGTSGNAANWRFIGWVFTNASTQFEDSPTNRLVVNYYNRVKKSLFANPGYVDDNADTTYALVSAVWAALNGGTGSQVSFIANGEDAVSLGYVATVDIDFGASFAPVAYIGIGVDTTTDPVNASRIANNDSSIAQTHVLSETAAYDFVSPGYHTADILGVMEGDSTVLVYADFKRLGASADPSATRLEGSVSV